MNPSDKIKKKSQLQWNAISTFLFVVLASTYPLTIINDYRRLGYIYTGKLRSGPDVVTATGNDALVIIYGVSVTMAIVWIITIYYMATCFKKIRRGEYSIQDESPEFVICSNCGTPQYSKDLTAGHCAKCTGNVENLDGYYGRHPELAPKLNKQSITQGEKDVSSDVNTCKECGKTFYQEECPDLICRDCQSNK